MKNNFSNPFYGMITRFYRGVFISKNSKTFVLEISVFL